MKLKHNYNNLKTCPSGRRVWQKGLEIVFVTSDLLETFPKKEQYNLTSQLSG